MSAKYQWLRKGMSVRRIFDERTILNVPGNIDWEKFEIYVEGDGVVLDEKPNTLPRDFSNSIPVELKAVLLVMGELTGQTPAKMKAMFKAKFNALRDS